MSAIDKLEDRYRYMLGNSFNVVFDNGSTESHRHVFGGVLQYIDTLTEEQAKHVVEIYAV